MFVTGGTGVLGRRAVRLLVADGLDVTVLARSPDKAAQITQAGATPAAVSLFDQSALASAMAGHDVVLNLATHIPDLAQMARPSAWNENNQIRTAGSLAVVSAAGPPG